jgi:hypothetical protein
VNLPRSVFLTVILFLGFALLVCLTGAVALTINGDTIPDMLKEIAVGCLTGLTGMLVQHSSTDAQPVIVQQPADQPVPVDPGPTFPGKAVAAPRKRSRS